MPDELNTATAFDAVAADYDLSFSDTAVGQAQRSRVWHFLGQVLQNRKISTVLECNCGTGVDARWLAGRGLKVTATDASPEMVSITRKKADGLNIQTTVCTLQETHLDVLVSQSAPYDLLFSDFGGLNCLSPGEIRQWNDDLLPIMGPDAGLALVVMSRFSWWETLYFLLKLKPRTAFRRWSRQAIHARLDADTTIPTWYYGPRELSALLPDFQVKQCYPVGFWLPPSYLDPFFRRRLGLLRILEWLEKKSATRLLAPAADHYFLMLERKSAKQAE